MATEMDRLFLPSIEFGGGCAEGSVRLLVNATAAPPSSPSYGQPSFVLQFENVVMLAGYSETAYWSLAVEPTRPHYLVNKVIGPSILDTIHRRLPHVNHHALYLVCGSDMCCEVVAADEFKVSVFDNPSAARKMLAGRMTR